ncbi:hypothetical protein AGMMS50239_33450 [Bacteroidia bacterium]|nr:hypothetical protein AGMMS50239_33450 [Bacteroidia bacterium]GHV32198.1 hypothetical protein FACS1894177_08010 [Bacteroidia bacterium]
MNTTKKLSPSDLLASQFLEQAQHFNANVELIKVLKSRTYSIGEANVLVRASSEGNRRYFFGLNYLTVEEIANIDNPFVAFICGSIDRIVIIPAKTLFKYLPQISHDRNGEYKINIDRDLNIVLAGRNNRIDCSKFINNWDLLLAPPIIKGENKNTVEKSLHSVMQGRLIEIGNIRGYETYCPNKSWKFNDVKLEDITTLKTCPQLQFSDYNLLREIDVLWFRPKGNNFIPECAFEVELSTGVWSGVGRMATLMDYSNVGLYVIANDAKKYNQVMTSLYENYNRYHFVGNESLGDLYAAEKNLKELRYEIGL